MTQAYNQDHPSEAEIRNLLATAVELFREAARKHAGLAQELGTYLVEMESATRNLRIFPIPAAVYDPAAGRAETPPDGIDPDVEELFTRLETELRRLEELSSVAGSLSVPGWMMSSAPIVKLRAQVQEILKTLRESRWPGPVRSHPGMPRSH